jgi:hypothetical protein
MKRFSIFLLMLIAVQPLIAQTDGISYQAVILDPNGQELPGVDAEGNILPNTGIAIRFTIIDANNMEEYQEIQQTHTDEFGMINLVIGQADPDAFALISWNGTAKDLRVEIDFSGSGDEFVTMSRESMTFVPYAYHRNIEAHGTLEVDDATLLNSQLTVGGPTNLNSSLAVNNNNATMLTGPLSVDGSSLLNNELTVAGTTNLDDSLNVNNLSPTFLSGNLTVGADGKATFNGSTEFNAPAEFVQLGVNGTSQLNGKVNINLATDSVPGREDQYSTYPLTIEGSTQGIAIRVNGNRSISNNYISFWDSGNGDTTMWGRIEGITLDEQKDDPEYKWEHGTRIADIAINTAELGINIAEWFQSGIDVTAAVTSSTACLGVGACVTTPIPSFIVSFNLDFILKIANTVVSLANLGLAGTEEYTFLKFKKDNIGVSYQSGAGDYAEWLPKENTTEVYTEGEVVGIKNGYVTKDIWGAEKIMVVSTNPIVLGNMPQPGAEMDYVRIAFMGQVPVKVIGEAKPGDYILPSELGSGYGKAVHPEDMDIRNYSKIAGVVWSTISQLTHEIKLVNIAVGINTNDLNTVVSNQQKELAALRTNLEKLQDQFEKNNALLSSLLPGYAEATGIESATHEHKSGLTTEYTAQTFNKDDLIPVTQDDIIYFELSREQIELSFEMAREQYQQMIDDADQVSKLFPGNAQKMYKGYEHMVLMPLKDHPFWQKIDSDPEYKEEIILLMQSNLKKAMHTHKKYAGNYTDMEIVE